MKYLAIALAGLALFGCASQRAERLNKDGVAAAGRNDYRAAAASLGEAVHLRPDVAKYHYNFGIALARSGYYDQAVMEFQSALRIQPHYPDASRALTVSMSRIQERQADEIAAVITR